MCEVERSSRIAARERRATVQSLPLLTHCSRRHAARQRHCRRRHRRHATTAAPPRRALCTVQWVGAVRKSTYGKGATPSNSPFGASLLFVLSRLAAVHIDMNQKQKTKWKHVFNQVILEICVLHTCLMVLTYINWKQTSLITWWVSSIPFSVFFHLPV